MSVCLDIATLAEVALVAAWASYGLTPDEADLISPAPRGAVEARYLAAEVMARRGIAPEAFAPHVGLTVAQVVRGYP